MECYYSDSRFTVLVEKQTSANEDSFEPILRVRCVRVELQGYHISGASHAARSYVSAESSQKLRVVRPSVPHLYVLSLATEIQFVSICKFENVQRIKALTSRRSSGRIAR